MQAACAKAGVPLAAGALQFSLRERRVTSTIVGVSEPGGIDTTLRFVTTAIPDGLRNELDRLMGSDRRFSARSGSAGGEAGRRAAGR
jgi:D-threo-aldose 1-dehydrogenase